MARDKWHGRTESPSPVTCHSSLASRVTRHSSLVTFKELKPQQTGTGFLTRNGEVATTSGSTNFR